MSHPTRVTIARRGFQLYLVDPAAAAAKSLQLCLTLCDPIDGSPPGSPIPGILQARTLEWVAISFSNVWKWSRVWLLAIPWIAAHQAPLSMGFSRQEYWSGVTWLILNNLYPPDLPLPLQLSSDQKAKTWKCCVDVTYLGSGAQVVGLKRSLRERLQGGFVASKRTGSLII